MRGFCVVLAVALLAVHSPAQPLFTIARLQYGGGGDWYSDPSSLPNLLRFLREHTQIDAAEAEARVQIMDEELFSYPYIYMTGHGNVAFSAEEAARLRALLGKRRLSPRRRQLRHGRELPPRHAPSLPQRRVGRVVARASLFHCHFELSAGLPKVHEHDGKRPQALALFAGERLAVLYTYEADLGDGWEDPDVHNDPEGQATRRPQNGGQHRGLGAEPLAGMYLCPALPLQPIGLNVLTRPVLLY